MQLEADAPRTDSAAGSGDADRRRLGALLDTVKQIAALTAPETLTDAIAEATAGLLGFEAGGFRLVEGDELVVVGQWGAPSMVRSRLKLGESLSGQAAATGRILVAEDLPNDPRVDPVHREADRRLGYRTLVVAPLRRGTRVTGVLVLRSRAHRHLGPDELSLVQAFADHAAIALENARLYASEQRQRQQAEALTEIARDVSAALDRDTVLQRVVEHACRLCRAELAVLALCEPGGTDAAVVAKTGHRTSVYERMVLRAGEGLGGQVLATRQPATTVDQLNDPRWPPDEAARLEGLRATVVVPVLAGAALLGVLGVHRRTAEPFEPHDASTVEALARHAAVAIQNAALYTTAGARAAELQRALEELRASQDHLVQTERLRALGEMAGGVAHDFNNLLAVILGRAQLLLLRAEEPDLRRGLTIIERAAADAAHTVRRIQEFSRTRQTGVFEPVDLREVVREAVELTKGRWKDEAQVRGVTYAVGTELGEAPLVAGEAAELREVFTNLILNAVDAMPQGGRIDVAVRHDAGGVIATVHDTGPGMPPEVRERIFEPFFTTKGPRSAGLGLSMAYGIVKRHGGRIEVESREGEGTRFTVGLPVPRQVPRPPDQPALAPSAPHGSLVLLVDDEPGVREVLADVLRSAGHVPLVAGDGPAGLALVERTRPPDLALIDLGLPGMSGWEVAARLRDSWPAVPIVLITGWGDRLNPADLERSGICQVIAKPFQTEDALRVVAQRARGPGRPDGRLTEPGGGGTRQASEPPRTTQD